MRARIVTQAIVNEIFKQNNKFLPKGENQARCGAFNIIALWHELHTTEQMEVAQEQSISQRDKMLDNAIKEIESQSWQEYTPHFEEAKAYLS